MSTKAEIESLIDTVLASTSDITATEHRSVLKDDADSVLTNTYATEVTDSDATETFFTLQSVGLASFTMSILKQGREVTVSASVTAITDVFRLGSFSSGELTVQSGGLYYATGYNISSSMVEGVEVRDVGGVTSIFFTDTLGAGDSVVFTIIYNTNA